MKKPTLKKATPSNYDDRIVGAQNIRSELRYAFPYVKFSVRGQCFAGGDAIRVHWTDGPTVKQVENITDKYVGSTFDGMQDLKECRRTDFNSTYGNADYVTTSREVSSELKEQVRAFFETERFAPAAESEYDYSYMQTHRLLYHTEVPKNGKFARIGERDEVRCYSGSSPQEKFFVVFEGESGPSESAQVDGFEVAETTHAKKGVPLFVASLVDRISREEYLSILDTAKSFGGYYSKFSRKGAIPGFQFPDAESRQEFIDAVTLPPSGDPKPAKPRENRQAKALRKSADGLEKVIDSKINNATALQNPTPRRASIAANMESEGMHLQKVQALMRIIADKLENGDCRPEFSSVKGREAAIALYGSSSYARKLVESVGREDEKQTRIRQMERSLIGSKIDGFFETPPEVAKRMVDFANIGDDMLILEPNGGAGAILEGLKEAGFDNVETCETSHALREVLKAKGFEVVAHDFLSFDTASLYDRILMNPPFEKGADADHIRKAWRDLNIGGRLVAICSEGLFFRTASKESAFREWLSGKLEHEEKLEPGTFAGGRITSTNAASRLIVLQK